MGSKGGGNLTQCTFLPYPLIPQSISPSQIRDIIMTLCVILIRVEASSHLLIKHNCHEVI